MNNGFVVALFFILPSIIIAKIDIKYETKYVEMPVDHFSFNNNDTFKLRYLENKDYWAPDQGAPIFFYTGNEGDIEEFCNNTGYMWEIGPDFKALIIFAEHRYYGLSLPYGNKSFVDKKHVGYLTSSQALADYVDLISHIKSSYKLDKLKNPVIAFGGSYGGMLAAWIRMKYPASVAGAIAASAPIWQFTGMTPCYAFNRVTTSAYKSTSSACFESIKNSWEAITNISSTADGKTWLGKTFNLCKLIKNEKQVQDFKDWLKNIFTNTAMVNYPYPANFLADLPGNPVEAMCKHFKSSYKSDKDRLLTLFDVVSVYFNYTGKAKCLDTQQDSNSLISDMGWEYQSCMEMVMPMCDDGEGDMFEASKWNFTEYSDECFSKYGLRPEEYLIEHLYGGKHISAASNIIFSNGLLDPWSSGGVLYNISKTLVSVLIPEGAHHLDLRESNTNDPTSVRMARKYYRQHIKHWIADHKVKVSNL